MPEVLILVAPHLKPLKHARAFPFWALLGLVFKKQVISEVYMGPPKAFFDR